MVEAHGRDPGTWMVKPDNLFGGHGMRLVDAPSESLRQSGLIIQRYLANAFLIHKRKPNLRVCILFTSYAPLRAYLYRGVETRVAVAEFDPDKIDELPMHIVKRKRFIEDYADLVTETGDITGNKHNLIPYPELLDRITAVGGDVDAFWDRLMELARGVVETIGNAGIVDAQASLGSRYCYPPKVVALDLFLDAQFQPWLLELERLPDLDIFLKVDPDEGAILRRLTEMSVYPYLSGDDATPDSFERFKDPAFRAAHEAQQEANRCGRFVRLNID